MEEKREGEIELLTVKEVAKILRVSETKMRDMQHAGRIPFIKIVGAVRFDKQDILEYLKQQKRVPWRTPRGID